MAFPLLPLLFLAVPAYVLAMTRKPSGRKKSRGLHDPEVWANRLPSISEIVPEHDDWYLDSDRQLLFDPANGGFQIAANSGKSLGDIAKSVRNAAVFNTNQSAVNPVGFLIDPKSVPLEDDFDPKLREQFIENVTIVRVLPQYLRKPWSREWIAKGAGTTSPVGDRGSLRYSYNVAYNGLTDPESIAGFRYGAGRTLANMKTSPLIDFKELALKIAPGAMYVKYLSDMGESGTLAAIGQTFSTLTSGEAGTTVPRQVFFVLERNEICDPYPMTGRLGFGPRYGYWPSPVEKVLGDLGWCYARSPGLDEATVFPLGIHDPTWPLWKKKKTIHRHVFHMRPMEPFQMEWGLQQYNGIPTDYGMCGGDCYKIVGRKKGTNVYANNAESTVNDVISLGNFGLPEAVSASRGAFPKRWQDWDYIPGSWEYDFNKVKHTFPRPSWKSLQSGPKVGTTLVGESGYRPLPMADIFSEDENYLFPYIAMSKFKYAPAFEPYEGLGMGPDIESDLVTVPLEWGPSPNAFSGGPDGGVLVDNRLDREEWTVIDLSPSGVISGMEYDIGDGSPSGVYEMNSPGTMPGRKMPAYFYNFWYGYTADLGQPGLSQKTRDEMQWLRENPAMESIYGTTGHTFRHPTFAANKRS
jgi:hypothetical protein